MSPVVAELDVKINQSHQLCVILAVKVESTKTVYTYVKQTYKMLTLKQKPPCHNYQFQNLLATFPTSS